MRTIEVKKDQSLMDISLQEYGSVEFVFQLVRDNQLKGVTDFVQPGTLLQINDQIGNEAVIDYLKPFHIATLDEESTAEGIGYWVINETFKIDG